LTSPDQFWLKEKQLKKIKFVFRNAEKTLFIKNTCLIFEAAVVKDGSLADLFATLQ
jgi:hypothetical protein